LKALGSTLQRGRSTEARDAPILLKTLLGATELSPDERSALDEVARGPPT
jgi:hypothetical protein